MADNNPLDPVRASHEEEFFHQKNQELIARLRHQLETAERARALETATGIHDRELMSWLAELGITPENAPVLHLVPLFQVAWADGAIQPAEKELLEKAAAETGIEPETPAYAAFQELLKAIAAILALIALFFRMSFSPETLAAFAGIVLLVIVQLVALLRGSRREGWERWAHLLAAMTPWHLFVAGALFLEQGNHHPLPGPQLYFFSVAALLPLMVWALWPRPRTAEETPPPQPTAG